MPDDNLAPAPLLQDFKHYLHGLTDLNHDLEKRIDVRTHELQLKRARSESLLLNILPPPIAERLKRGEKMIADRYEQATIWKKIKRLGIPTW